MRAASSAIVNRRTSAVLMAVVASVATGLAVHFSPAAVLVIPLAVGSLGFFVLLTSRPHVGLYLVLMAVVFTTGIPRGTVVPLLKVNELALLLLAVIYGVHRLALRDRRAKAVRHTAVDKAFALFVVISFLTPIISMLFRAGVYPVESALRIMLGPLKLYLLYWLAVRIVRTKGTAETLMRLMLVASVVVSIVSFLQVGGLFGVGEFLNRYYNEPGLDYFSIGQRATSVFNPSWNTLGAYHALHVLLSLVYAIRLRRIGGHAWPFALVGAINCASLVLSGSLGSLVGLAVGIGVVCILLHESISRKIAMLLVGLIGVGTAYCVFPDVIAGRFRYQFGSGSLLPRSLAERLQIWSTDMWPVARESILFGVGPGSLRELTEHGVAESYYFYTLLHGGLATLFSYLVLMGTILATVHTVVLQSKKLWYHHVALLTLAIAVVILVMNISNEYFKYTGVGETFILLLALTTRFGSAADTTE